MLDINFIISPIVGGIIGGFANWLAIQMLFFPLSEKRILGIRIPFTPGLIPKERKRIAQSVANTVSNYFLSEEVIINAVISPQVEKQFKVYIKDLINSQKESTETVGQIIAKVTGENPESILKKYGDSLIDLVINQIKSPDILGVCVDYFSKQIDLFMDKNLNEIVSIGNLDNYKPYIIDKLNILFGSDKFREFVSIAISKELNRASNTKKRLKDIIPQQIIDGIKAKAVINSDIIAKMVIEYISSSSIQYKLRKYLKNSFESSFKLRMISKVIDIDKIFENMIEEIIFFLEQPESHKEIGLFIIKTIDSMTEKRIKDMFQNYDIEFTSDTVKELISKIDFSISEVLVDNILSSINNSSSSQINIRKIIESIEPKILESKEQFINKTCTYLIDKVFTKDLIKTILYKKSNELFNQKMSKYSALLRQPDINFIQDIIIKNYKKLISCESNRILKVIDISKIVEDRINAFDIGEMEDIMLKVIKKDIIVMRLFEAGIGFIIGFIIPLYPYIYRGVLNLIK